MLNTIRHSSLLIKIVFVIFSFFPLSLYGETNEFKKNNLLEMEKGSKNAPITIVEYASFTCPHCATFHRDVFKKIEKEYIEQGYVRFIYREIYFDAPGLWAGLIARCNDNSRYFGITNLLYEKQEIWTMANNEKEMIEELLSIAKLAGIEKKEALECLNNKEKALELVDFMKYNVENDNITSTPSLIINGELFSNMSYNDLKEKIDLILTNI